MVPVLGKTKLYVLACRSQWPRGLRRGSAVARLLRLGVRISPGAWMHVTSECCTLSNRRADHLFRGIPRSVACLSVIVEPDRVALGPLWLSSHEKENNDNDNNNNNNNNNNNVLQSQHTYGQNNTF